MSRIKRSKKVVAARRAEAEKMNEANALLSPAQKIAKLDKRLGVGEGAVKERARLAAQIEEAKNPKPKAAPVPTESKPDPVADVIADNAKPTKKVYTKGKKLTPA
jgi:hypothetical protein